MSEYNSKNEVTNLVRAYEKALLESDAATLERIFAAEFVFIEPTGAVVSRDSFLQQIRTKALIYESLTVDETDVRVYGDTAVALDASTVKGSNQGFDFSGRYRGVDVVVLRQGQWQMVVTQETAILEP
jgi:ketosteroid isomerase-like protein